LEAQWELSLNSIESEGMPTQGNGQQVLALASHDKGDRFPILPLESQVVGIDLSPAMLSRDERRRRTAATKNLRQYRRWSEDMQARFPAGTFARIETVLRENEYRMDFVREAVERELKRRERAMTAARRRQSQQTRLALSKVSHGRKRHMSDL
jgi:ubiquinone/menaquinone biosynthesis C-methylase UbiE